MQRTASTSRASTDEEQTNEKTDTPVAGWSECNVCFDVAKDPVVGSCGHLFCWPCIYQWLEARGDNATCPVCKAAIDKEHLVPIYGRGNESREDPREKIPPRPQGQRQERESQHEGGPFGMEGFNISFGIGAFPIGLFAGPLYTVFGNNNVQQQNARRQRPEEQVLARIFMVFTLLMILWLLIS